MHPNIKTGAPAADDPMVTIAIEWLVRLRSGEADAAQWEAFARWQAKDSRHAAAVRRLEQALSTFASLPDKVHRPVRQALLVSPGRRRALHGGLGLFAVCAASAWLTQRQTPLETLTADLRTPTGQRLRQVLADGSELWLNARSAVDIDFRSDARHLHLRSGELVVTVAPDARRPLIVHTDHGTVRALGTRFLVRQESGRAVVAVLHSSVRIDSLGGVSGVLSEGQLARFDDNHIERLPTTFEDPAAWTDGFTEIHDRPLSELITSIRPYRSGILRYSDAAGKLRVTGTFPLDDSERTLTALEETLPITLRRHTRYWVSIDLR